MLSLSEAESPSVEEHSSRTILNAHVRHVFSLRIFGLGISVGR